MNGSGFKTLEFQIQRHARKAQEIRKKIKTFQNGIDALTERMEGLQDLVVELENITNDCVGHSQSIERSLDDKFTALRNFNAKKDGAESRRLLKIIDQQNAELEILRSKERSQEVKVEKASSDRLLQASTICFFDSLLFAIENWSVDGQVASDISLCSQSILFPLVYQPVMRGDSDYYVDSFPTVSLEIVRRGREFVKWLRETSHSSLADKDTWDAYSDVIREWWVNDALPLIYGARSDSWVISSAYDFDHMLKWRDMPASRALDFPLIFDGMELVSKQMDNIREPMGLPNFMQNQNQTRIEL